jgi:hypothetical protein
MGPNITSFRVLSMVILPDGGIVLFVFDSGIFVIMPVFSACCKNLLCKSFFKTFCFVADVSWCFFCRSESHCLAEPDSHFSRTANPKGKSGEATVCSGLKVASFKPGKTLLIS